MYRSHPNKHLELLWAECDTGIPEPVIKPKVIKSQGGKALPFNKRLYLCPRCDGYQLSLNFDTVGE